MAPTEVTPCDVESLQTSLRGAQEAETPGWAQVSPVTPSLAAGHGWNGLAPAPGLSPPLQQGRLQTLVRGSPRLSPVAHGGLVDKDFLVARWPYSLPAVPQAVLQVALTWTCSAPMQRQDLAGVG